MSNIGIIGCGHWGPNHIRIFSHLSGSKAVICSDLDEKRLNQIKETFVNIETATDYQDVLNHNRVDAVCISTPTNTHYQLVKESLEAGKHVLCEKPLALTVDECRELKEVATEYKKVLMVGHVFVFNPGIQCLKDLITGGELGKVHYAYSKRTNLGPFRYDVNALWDLAPHDIAIFNYLFDSVAQNASARGQKSLGTSHEDLCFASLQFPDEILVNVHVSWLDPKKVRQIVIVGEKKMVIWDDLDHVGPVKLYDKHVEKTDTYYETYGEFQLLSREGNVSIPKITMKEPLKVQNQYFLQCIENGEDPELADGDKGEDVVRTLSAIQQSMEKNGESVKIG